MDLCDTLLRWAGVLGCRATGGCLGVSGSEMGSSCPLAVLAAWATRISSSSPSPSWPASESRYLDKDFLTTSRAPSDGRATAPRREGNATEPSVDSEAVFSRKSTISNGRPLIWTWPRRPLSASCQTSIILYLFIMSKNPRICTVYIGRSGCG
jgi:hypothetical protein